MLKLRRLLLCDKFYYFIFILSIIYILIITIVIKHESIYNIKNTDFVCMILNYKIDGNKLSLNLKCEENLIANYYFNKESELKAFKISFGDKIRLRGILKEAEGASLPNTFDYKKYLYNNRVYYILDVEEYNIISNSKNVFYFIKNSLYKKIDKIKDNDYIYAFVLGQTSFIDGDVNDTYRYNGVTHLFALSGSNVALIYVLISFILKKLKFRELSIHIIVSLFLLFIIFITGFSPSIIRASVFFIFYGINKIFYFHIKSINILLFTFFIITLYNPYIVYNIGFELSFVITFFLILYNKLFNSKNSLKNLFFVGLISFLSSAPIVAYNFYYLNFLSLFNNLIFVPLVSYIIFPLSLISFIFPFLLGILGITVKIMEFLSSFLYSIKLFSIIVPKISVISIFIYYLFLVLFSSKRKMKYAIIMFMCLFYTRFLNMVDGNYYIYFLDVGQGDSIFIKTPKDNIMIDTGGKVTFKSEEWKKKNNEYSYVKSTLTPFLNSIGENKIDYMFLTHGDADHMGYSGEITENIRTSNIYINKGELNYLERKLENAKETKEYYKIDNIMIHSINSRVYSNENDNSLVMILDIYKVRVLMMGDASKKVESNIINSKYLKNSDILKVGHHGSDTSTSEELLEVSGVKYGVISAGKGNKYGHPSENVINLLKRYKIKVLNTIDEDTIVFKINKKGLKIVNWCLES